MLAFLMRPANAVCDCLHLTDEHERGMVRMLVNMMVIGTVGFTVLCVGWLWLA